MKRITHLFLGAALFVPHVVLGEDPGVAVHVSWLYTPPDEVFFESASGQINLPASNDGKSFDKEVPIPSTKTIPLTLVARYGRDDVKLLINVRRGYPPLYIVLPRSTPLSCNSKYVSDVEESADTAAEAMRLMLEARYLLNMNTSNTDSPCPQIPPTLLYKSKVARAQFDRNYDLVQHGHGLYAMDPDAERLFVDNSENKDAAEQYARTYLIQAEGVHVETLYHMQSAASNNKDWETAVNINKELLDTKNANEISPKAFATQGITSERLIKDGAFFDTKMKM